MALRRTQHVFASVAVHLGALAVVALLARRHRPSQVSRELPVTPVVMDFDTEAPPPVAPPPPSELQRPVAPSQIAPSTRRASAPPRVDRALPVAASPEPLGTPSTGAVAPPTATTPTQAPAQPAPHIDAMELLRSTRNDAERLVTSGAMTLDVSSATRPSRDLVRLPSGTPLERAREASAGYVRGRLAEAPPRPEAPGVRTYFWNLRRRMTETWRPGIARSPTVGETLLATLAMPLAAQQRAAELALGQGARPGRAGSAIDALDSAGGRTNSDATHSDPAQGNGPRPMLGIADLAQLNSYITRTVIEVDQREDGTVIEIRVVRPSRVAGYDDAAMAAVREALPLQTPARMPGGRRSQWSFQTVASRAPFVPGVGMAFDESSGWFEVSYPGRVTLRSRVWLESARPLSS